MLAINNCKSLSKASCFHPIFYFLTQIINASCFLLSLSLFFSPSNSADNLALLRQKAFLMDWCLIFPDRSKAAHLSFWVPQNAMPCDFQSFFFFLIRNYSYVFHFISRNLSCSFHICLLQSERKEREELNKKLGLYKKPCSRLAENKVEDQI